MSGSTESQRSFLSRRGFFGRASSLAAALGMSDLRQRPFVADDVVASGSFGW